MDISNQRLPNTRLGLLHPGSRFVGIQECGTNKYEVVVDIQVCWVFFQFLLTLYEGTCLNVKCD